uniref:Uncharacterized protein n=1 Tax=Anopheles maculatus TaxID=74869 RepID=A0A182SM24_9DIPT
MLLTSLLSSACSLAVPSAAQKHFASGGDDQPHGTTLPAFSSSTFVGSTYHPAGVASVTLLHQHQPHERKQHGHRRPVDTGHDSSEEATNEDRHVPDLYNLTLAAMRQYLRNHLNESRLGKAPRKRSHVHVDAVDVEFYRRFKEFNSSQAVLDGAASHLPVVGTNSSQHGQDPSIGGPTLQSESLPNSPDEPSLTVVTNVTAEPSSPATTSSVVPAGTASPRDYSVLMDDPRGYITASSSFPLRPGKTSTTWNTTFAQHRARLGTTTSTFAKPWGQQELSIPPGQLLVKSLILWSSRRRVTLRNENGSWRPTTGDLCTRVFPSDKFPD